MVSNDWYVYKLIATKARPGSRAKGDATRAPDPHLSGARFNVKLLLGGCETPRSMPQPVVFKGGLSQIWESESKSCW